MTGATCAECGRTYDVKQRTRPVAEGDRVCSSCMQALGPAEASQVESQPLDYALAVPGALIEYAGPDRDIERDAHYSVERIIERDGEWLLTNTGQRAHLSWVLAIIAPQVASAR